MSEIKLIKLNCGQELVAEITQKKDMLHIKNAVQFMMSGQGLSMVSWLPLCKSEEYDIPMSQVLCMGDLQDEILDAYKQEFGKIVIPSSTLKLST